MLRKIGCVPFVIITIPSCPHSLLVTNRVTRVTGQMSQVEQELLIPEEPNVI